MNCIVNGIRGSFLNRLVIFCAVFCLVGISQNGVRVDADQPVITPSDAVFVTYRIDKASQNTKRGVFTRQLSEAEAATLNLKTSAGNARPLRAAATRAKASPQQQLTWFTLTPTPQLEAAPQARAAVQRALAKWEAAFEQLPQTEVRVDFGPTLFGGQFPAAPPSTAIAVTAVPIRFTPYSELQGFLQQRTFDARQQALYDALPADRLPTDVGLAQLIRVPLPLGRMIGIAVGGGNDAFTIGFNSNNKFDFDPSDGIDPDKLDFEALVLREVGRALGFISGTGIVEAQLDTRSNVPPPGQEMMWDIFRFRGSVTLADFGTAQRAQLSGGEQVFFAGGQDLPLSTGRPDGQGGDGRPAGHWKDDELTGQYIGIMDPTYAPGERGGITANDLAALDYFGYTMVPQTPVIEVLSNDDNSREEALSLDGAMAVTRLLPGRFPCTVQSVRLQLPDAGGVSPVGKQMRLVIFADPAGTGRPPVNAPLLLDRTIIIPALPENRMLEVMLPNGPTINAGDLYIGWQTPAGLLLAGDANVAQQRSFVSTNNGASFQPLRAATQRPVNLIARAVVKAAYGDLSVPKIASLSPASVVPGAGSFQLYVYGQNFTGNGRDGFNATSIVRWNGQDRATEFVNGSRLIATIDGPDVAGAGTARITVFTRTDLNETVESAPAELAITATHPVPSLLSVNPPGGQLGSAGMMLKIQGRNFAPDSVVIWKGSLRYPEFTDSTKLSLFLSKDDLATMGTAEIAIQAPEPGGGTSEKVTFPISPCHYASSAAEQLVNINGGAQGVLVLTDSFCQWTAQSDVPWINITGMNNGVGRGFLTYEIADNYNASGRTGAVTFGDAKMIIRQSGYAKAVSAASFTASLAPESIASVFTLGLGSATSIASTAPLPTKIDGLQVRVRSALGVERLAPLFFTSPEQINFQVPAGTTPGLATIFINGTPNYGTVQIAAVAPSFFTANASGQGLAAAIALRVKPDGTQSFEPVAEFDSAQKRIVARPIDLGAEGDQVFLLMFGTGIRGRTALTGVGVKIDGVDSAVSFAGAQGDFVGLDQVNVKLPNALRGRGEVNINCTVEGRAANAVTVVIK